ncbi:MAG: hypothetical protein M3348_01140 [Acidobacteriota bacterium]|nr:hypothetical protein [Acidobacteriota bacterium]
MKISLSPEWITAIAGIITALTIILIWWQIRADHERSRREKAIELMDTFTGRIHEISPGVRYARKLLDKLDERQCECLWNLDAFSIDAKHEYLLNGSLEELGKNLRLEKEGSQILLTQTQVSVLRSLTASYLNILETIFAAWRHNIADREIIEDEFDLLIMPKKDHFPLEKIRIASGKYPSLAAFSDAIKRKRSRMPEKSKVA